MCFVNGECCQGSLCDLCEPQPSTPAPSALTTERTSTAIPPATELKGKKSNTNSEEVRRRHK